MSVTTELENTSRTDEQLAQDEKVVCSQDPFYLIENGYLSIKTKSADLIRLKPNSAQRAVIDAIRFYQEKGKPIRIWCLKARQEGISTLTEAIIYSIASQHENINALIMADDKEHASNLFEMSKLYHSELEKDPNPYLAPTLKKSNEKKLEFEEMHSQIIIATADNTDSARSHTFQIVHLSEVALFREFKEVMGGLSQSVPDLPNTIIIGESTARGMNEFYDAWMDSVQGKNDWIPIFIPWFWMTEYSLPLENGLYHLDGIKFTSDMSEARFIKKEKELKIEHDLSEEQINWRRYAIINKCQGDLDIWNREYPSNYHDAFVVSGENFFDIKGLKKQEAMKKIPKDKGEVFEEQGKYIFRSLEEGRIKIYETPLKYEQYIITMDTSEAKGQDEASILVGNVRTNSTVAVANGHYSIGELADMGTKLGYYYNNAIIAPESNSYGYSLCQDIYSMYGNIYRKIRTNKGKLEQTEELGFNTNAVTRPQILSKMAEAIRLNSTLLLDKDLIDQCFRFVVNPKNLKAEASPGSQDGLIICFGIFQQVRAEKPYHAPAKPIQQARLKNELMKEHRNGGFSF